MGITPLVARDYGMGEINRRTRPRRSRCHRRTRRRTDSPAFTMPRAASSAQNSIRASWSGAKSSPDTAVALPPRSTPSSPPNRKSIDGVPEAARRKARSDDQSEMRARTNTHSYCREALVETEASIRYHANAGVLGQTLAPRSPWLRDTPHTGLVFQCSTEVERALCSAVSSTFDSAGHGAEDVPPMSSSRIATSGIRLDGD